MKRAVNLTARFFITAIVRFLPESDYIVFPDLTTFIEPGQVQE